MAYEFPGNFFDPLGIPEAKYFEMPPEQKAEFKSEQAKLVMELVSHLERDRSFFRLTASALMQRFLHFEDKSLAVPFDWNTHPTFNKVGLAAAAFRRMMSQHGLVGFDVTPFGLENLPSTQFGSLGREIRRGLSLLEEFESGMQTIFYALTTEEAGEQIRLLAEQHDDYPESFFEDYSHGWSTKSCGDELASLNACLSWLDQRLEENRWLSGGIGTNGEERGEPKAQAEIEEMIAGHMEFIEPLIRENVKGISKAKIVQNIKLLIRVWIMRDERPVSRRDLKAASPRQLNDQDWRALDWICEAGNWDADASNPYFTSSRKARNAILYHLELPGSLQVDFD